MTLPGAGAKHNAWRNCAHVVVKKCRTTVGGAPSIVEVDGWNCTACDADFTTSAIVRATIGDRLADEVLIDDDRGAA